MDKPLIIDVAPVTKRAPKHFADLAPEERAQAVSELEEQGFRAKQLANHYFARHNDDPESWTDISPAIAKKLADGLFPKLLTAVRTI